MSKIDKRQYSKQEWHRIREQRRIAKMQRKMSRIPQSSPAKKSNQIAFVLGNGTSREGIDLEEISKIGKVYACNAVYRTFAPDYLVAVDVKMILEINKHGYQRKHEVWTNPNRAYDAMSDLRFFQPSKGWSSGPTALWLASQHGYEKIYILGFDYKGLGDGSQFNNLYADTPNYKKSSDGATFFGNWLRQTSSVIKQNPNINYVRVITPDNYNPEELNKSRNYSLLEKQDFKKIFDLS